MEGGEEKSRHSTPRDTGTNGSGGRASGYRLPSSIYNGGCIEIAKQMEPTEREKKKKKRIEARVGQTIRYRPLVGGCRRFARRGWSGEEDPRGGGGKLKSSFTWKRFDWRRSANDFRSATPRRLSTYPTPPAHPVRYTPPRPDHFFESGGGGGGGGRARLAEIRTARQIET